MRNFGYLVLAVGFFCIMGALVMDVSVSSGAGRVNNIGLMADRQNYILIGGLMLLISVIMIAAGKRQIVAVDSSHDCRACPICAETIKCAAVMCKHCGSEVERAKGLDSSTPINEPMSREELQIWIARGIILAIFVGIICVSLLNER